MKSKLLQYIYLSCILVLTACSTVPNYQVTHQGAIKQYCHKTYHYCVDLPKDIDEQQLKYLVDGFAFKHSSGYKMVIIGGLFDDKKSNNSLSEQLFTEEVLPLNEEQKRSGWRTIHLNDKIHFTQGIAYINQNEHYVTSGNYHYRVWVYNKKGYVDVLVSYPAHMQREITPMFEQLINSIVLKN